MPLERLLASVNRIKPAPVPVEKLPEEIKASIRALKPEARRFHGVKLVRVQSQPAAAGVLQLGR